MDEYLYWYPRTCSRCAGIAGATPDLKVAPFVQAGNDLRIMLVGQDPTIARSPERVQRVLMLDDLSSALARWLRGLFGERAYHESTIYATNVVKCSFRERPGASQAGGPRFLQPYFGNCQSYLREEVVRFHPTLVLTFGEPAHRLFVSLLDKPHMILTPMKDAFTGDFNPAWIAGVTFDYSPCLHIQTFRVAETYGDKVRAFKQAATAYLEKHGREDRPR